MKAFVELYIRLDQTNSTNEKIAAMVDYFQAAPADDAAWAIYFLSGNRLKRLLKRQELKDWLLHETGYPLWLFEETYQSVGDLAETIALLLPEPTTDELDDTSLTTWVTARIQPLNKLDETERREHVTKWWRQLNNDARFVLNKMLTGAFRVGVSKRLVIRALAQVSGLDTAVIAHRLMGNWQPDADLLPRLFNPDVTEVDASTPYPFYLASPLLTDNAEHTNMADVDEVAAQLGDIQDWAAEWKWDGIRAQLIRRKGQTFLWSRGEELLEGRFPEIETAAAGLPDGSVLDGEVLAWFAHHKADKHTHKPLPFAQLQRRIGRLKPGPKLLKEAPVIFLAYDCLEHNATDIRTLEYQQRQQSLCSLVEAVGSSALQQSQAVPAASWQALAALREESRERGVEGFMLKRRNSPYLVGRKRGDWWKWKIDPYTIDAVLLYAQPGSGRRSNLLTDYTFAVWQGEPGNSDLVPVTKAYSGLNNDEIAELDKWIRRHTKERFGPVRSVKPQHVFELAFEGIQLSSRHKSGVAFRFPRIARWRQDLGIIDAETLEQVKALL